MTKAHAKLSPSASERWTQCPGSIRLSEGIPNRETEYSAEGTCAHQLAERCLSKGTDAIDYLGVELKAGAYTFKVDQDMIDAVQTYVDWARALPGDAEIEYEQKLDLTFVHPEMFGTGDLVAYVPSERRLIVADYKHGRGVAVDPEENSQAKSYALGAAMRMHNRGVDRIDIVIVQPRCPHPAGSVRVWSTDAVALLDWSADLKESALATEDPEARLRPGDWCKFCPAAATCPALADLALETARADFANDGTLLVPDPAKLDRAALAIALDRALIIEGWIKRVREVAHHEAEAGRAVPGWKLVAKRATRKWRLPEERIADTLGMLTHLQADDIYERSMRSPAQVEKLLGKKLAASVLPGLIEKTSSGAVLAPENDPRPALSAEAARDFAGVPV